MGRTTVPFQLPCDPSPAPTRVPFCILPPETRLESAVDPPRTGRGPTSRRTEIFDLPALLASPHPPPLSHSPPVGIDVTGEDPPWCCWVLSISGGGHHHRLSRRVRGVPIGAGIWTGTSSNLLQGGLPAGASPSHRHHRRDRNYVNWVRGGERRGWQSLGSGCGLLQPCPAPVAPGGRGGRGGVV